MLFARPLAQLIAQLEKLPGVGPKSAQRLAFHILRMPVDDVRLLADSLTDARRLLGFCKICQNISEAELCPVCSDPRRRPDVICIVSETKDIAAIERLNQYRGLYHVLHGELNPLQGMSPEQLRIKELLARLGSDVEELIVATNPTTEGDATALYLARLLKPMGFKITRLARGMPVGGELDYADSATLLDALEHRREMT
jgi:recombination protein RecR